MRRFLTLGFSLLLCMLAFAVWPRSVAPVSQTSQPSRIAYVGNLFLPTVAAAQAVVDTTDTLGLRGSRAVSPAPAVIADSTVAAPESHTTRWILIGFAALIVFACGLWYWSAVHAGHPDSRTTSSYTEDRRT
jgi:hypothetical protein